MMREQETANTETLDDMFNIVEGIQYLIVSAAEQAMDLLDHARKQHVETAKDEQIGH